MSVAATAHQPVGHPTAPDREMLRRLFLDPRCVQAGAYLAGYFRHQPDAGLSLPLSIPGRQDWSSDVAIPDWPYSASGEDTRQILNLFADAGILTRAGGDRFRLLTTGMPLLHAFPLYHLRDTENLPARFEKLETAVQGRRVLDAGCGLAAYTLMLRSLGPRQLAGLDYSDSQLLLATKLATALDGVAIRFLRGSVEGLPLADASVDFIFCRVVLPLVHHGRTISEFARILASGGRALLMLHGPRYYFNMMKRVGFSGPRLREFVFGSLGLLGGAIFDLTGREPAWKLKSRPFHLIYERRAAFERLAVRFGLQIESWEAGELKPYVWLRKL